MEGINNLNPGGESPGFNPLNWDWFAYLDAPKDVRRAHYNEAELRASNWVTCACGQLCKGLERVGKRKQPSDWLLFNFGRDFYKLIELKDFEGAKEVLHLIESRTSELLKEMDHGKQDS